MSRLRPMRSACNRAARWALKTSNGGRPHSLWYVENYLWILTLFLRKLSGFLFVNANRKHFYSGKSSQSVYFREVSKFAFDLQISIYGPIPDWLTKLLKFAFDKGRRACMKGWSRHRSEISARILAVWGYLKPINSRSGSKISVFRTEIGNFHLEKDLSVNQGPILSTESICSGLPSANHLFLSRKPRQVCNSKALKYCEWNRHQITCFPGLSQKQISAFRHFVEF